MKVVNVFRYKQQNQTLKYIMFRDSEVIIQDIVGYIMKQVWNGVAREHIAKIAPTSAKLQAFQFMNSHISNATHNKQKINNFSEQKFAQNIPLDTFTVNSANVKQIKKKQQQNNGQLSQAGSTIRSRRRQTDHSFFSKKSISDAKSKIIQGKQQQLFKLPQPQDINNVYDPQQDEIRNKILLTEQMQKKRKQQKKQKQQQRQVSEERSKKILKDLKKFTNDYAGGYMGIGNFAPGQEKVLKLTQKNKEQIIAKHFEKKAEEFNIKNQKSKQRETKAKLKQAEKANDKNKPQFDENRPESLIDAFQDQSKISQGVKLTGNKGAQQLTKQRVRKLSGMKKYRRNQFQNIIKQNKFKQFTKVSNSSAQLINQTQINKTAPIPIQNTIQPTVYQHKSKTKSQLSFKGQKTLDDGGILPPLKMNKNERFFLKKSFRNNHHYSKSHSNRTIDVSGLSSRMTLKSKQKIIIDNQEDFKFLLKN